jgi:ABC-2 type transport system permease protein
MSGIWLIARRDFSAFVNTLWGWVILSLALLIDGLLFNAVALTSTARYSAEVLTDFFLITGGVALFAAVAITMRLFAEERQTGTIVLLESSPLSEVQSVLGKYLSGLMFLGLFLALTSFMPAMVMVNGKVSAEEIGVGYLGLFLLGSAGIAIGTWASAISRNQLIALVIAAAVTLFFVMCWMLSRVLDAPFKGLFAYMAFFDKHLSPFQEGRINTEGIVFFVSVSFAFLLLATRSLIARRWE